MSVRSSPALCQHGNKICAQCVIITDAARKMSDAINSRLTFSNPIEIAHCYMAFKLQDGSTDGNLYDSKADAIRHVSDYRYWAFFCFRNALGGANPKDCQLFLDIHRHAYENGGQLADPDDVSGGPDAIVPIAQHDSIFGRVRQPKSRLWLPGMK